MHSGRFGSAISWPVNSRQLAARATVRSDRFMVSPQAFLFLGGWCCSLLPLRAGNDRAGLAWGLRRIADKMKTTGSHSQASCSVGSTRGKHKDGGHRAEASACGVLHYCSYWRKRFEAFFRAIRYDSCNCPFPDPNQPTFREPFSCLSLAFHGFRTSQYFCRLYTPRKDRPPACIKIMR